MSRARPVLRLTASMRSVRERRGARCPAKGFMLTTPRRSASSNKPCTLALNVETLPGLGFARPGAPSRTRSMSRTSSWRVMDAGSRPAPSTSTRSTFNIRTALSTLTTPRTRCSCPCAVRRSPNVIRRSAILAASIAALCSARGSRPCAISAAMRAAIFLASPRGMPPDPAAPSVRRTEGDARPPSR